MRSFWIIRHGESEGNAGLPSSSDAATPLTARGKKQAEYISEYIQTRPDVFILSPYLRAAQTAIPTLAKFPDVPIETWPIQEFSYLSHEQYKNTISASRRKISKDFFLRGDPDLVLGDGGESFNQFINRIHSCLMRLSASPSQYTVLFGHGWFMRAMLWYLFAYSQETDYRKMVRSQIISFVPSYQWFLRVIAPLQKYKISIFRFLLFSSSVHIPNGGILKFSISNEEYPFSIIGFSSGHIPKHIQSTSLSNR